MQISDSRKSGSAYPGYDDTPDDIDGITQDMLEEYKEAFELFDKDGDGTISTGELKNLLRCFEVDLPDYQVQEIIDRYDVDNMGSLRFDSLKEVMASVQKTQEIDDEIYQVYKLFDREGNGVTAEALCNMMNQLLDLKQEQQFAQYGITGNEPEKNETEAKLGQTIKGDDGLDESQNQQVLKVTLDECKLLVKHADTDGDGILSFDEFAAILMEKSSKFKQTL